MIRMATRTELRPAERRLFECGRESVPGFKRSPWIAVVVISPGMKINNCRSRSQQKSAEVIRLLVALRVIEQLPTTISAPILIRARRQPKVRLAGLRA